MTTASRILLAEDDSDLGPALVEALRRDGFDVTLVTDGISAYAALKASPPDALLLDLGLPEMDGLDLLHRLRQGDSDMPVIVTTARAGPGDRIRGLDFGADDYLVKPFDPDELTARLRALLRRAGHRASRTLRVRDVELDLATHQVSLGGEAVWLTGQEFAVLKLLMQNLGVAVSRESIEKHLYGWGGAVEANAVEVCIYNLRRKLGRDFIHTYRGSGYVVSR